jgi:hypothetical protein
MDLQEHQWETGEDDFVQLAKVSRDITKEASARAVHEARQDLSAARHYLQDLAPPRWSPGVPVGATDCHSAINTAGAPTRSKSILKTRHSTSDPPSTSFLFPEKTDNRQRDSRSTHDRRAAPSRAKSLPASDGGKRSRSTPPIQRERAHCPTRTIQLPVTPAAVNSKPTVGCDSSMPTLTPMQRAKARVARPTLEDASEHRRKTIATALSSNVVELQSKDVKRVPRRCKSALLAGRQATPNSQHRRIELVSSDKKTDSIHSRSQSASFAGDDDSDDSGHDGSGPFQNESLQNMAPQPKNCSTEICSDTDGNLISTNGTSSNLSEHQRSFAVGPKRQLPTRRKYNATLGSERVTKLSNHDSSRHRRKLPQRSSSSISSSDTQDKAHKTPSRRISREPPKISQSAVGTEGATDVSDHDSSHHRRAPLHRRSSSSIGTCDTQGKVQKNSSHHRRTASQSHGNISVVNDKQPICREPPKRSQSAIGKSPESLHHRQRVAQHSSDQGDLRKRRPAPPQRAQSASVDGTGLPLSNSNPSDRRKGPHATPQRPQNATVNDIAIESTSQKRSDGREEQRPPPQRTKSAATSPASMTIPPKLASHGRPPQPITSPRKVRPDPSEKSRQAPIRTKSLPAITPWAQREIKASLDTNTN